MNKAPVVASTHHHASDEAAFLDATAQARALFLAARGCRNVTVFRSGDGRYRVAVEWRTEADRAAFASADAGAEAARLLSPFATAEAVVESVIEAARPPPSDAKILRQVFGHYPTGVAVVTAPGPLAMVVTSFTSVSLDPPLVSFCAAHTSGTWPLIADAKRCCVNVLAKNHGEVSRLLATRKENRFEGIVWSAAPSGAPLLDGVVAWLDCAIVETRVAGDHDLVLLQVMEHGSKPDVEPLVFHRSGYRALEG